MLQIVVNVERDRRRRRRDFGPASNDITATAPTPVECASAEELNEIIQASIDGLPDRQREVACLVFGEGISAAETACVLGISEANVHTCVHLARKRIAKALGANYSRRK
jgi:RNA polymerase sigma factor (sigma-70 family)